MKPIIKTTILAFGLSILLGQTGVLVCAQSNEPDVDGNPVTVKLTHSYGFSIY